MPLFCLQKHEFRGRTSVGRNYGDINPIFVNPLHVILYPAYGTKMLDSHHVAGTHAHPDMHMESSGLPDAFTSSKTP